MIKAVKPRRLFLRDIEICTEQGHGNIHAVVLDEIEVAGRRLRGCAKQKTIVTGHADDSKSAVNGQILPISVSHESDYAVASALSTSTLH